MNLRRHCRITRWINTRIDKSIIFSINIFSHYYPLSLSILTYSYKVMILRESTTPWYIRRAQRLEYYQMTMEAAISESFSSWRREWLESPAEFVLSCKIWFEYTFILVSLQYLLDEYKHINIKYLIIQFFTQCITHVSHVS